MAIHELAKWVLFPGINLHARLRFRTLPRYFGVAGPGQDRLVLDAGCGNGMLSYESFQKGNRVLGISIKPDEISKARKLYQEHLQLPPDRIEFREWNIYDLEKLNLTFDEIICTEVLEHLSRDREVIAMFYRILKPSGVLHLCCPNAEHPDNQLTHLDEKEAGGHFRSGYTVSELRNMMESVGFRIDKIRGLGGPIRQAINRNLIQIQQKAGFLPGFILFFLTWPLIVFDSPRPIMPYSIYIQGQKGK